MKRTYSYLRIYVISCSECGENIVERCDERDLTNRGEAEEYAQRHEDIHLREEAYAASRE